MNHTRTTAAVSPSFQDFIFSQASLQDYIDCHRRFQLRYVDGLPWPAVVAEPATEHELHQREGQLFHRLVQQRLLGMPAEALSRGASSERLQRWWQNFTSAGPDLSGWQLHTEKTLSCKVGAHRLIAKYDLLAIRGGQAVIYDWKTYTVRPRMEWLAARMQTRVYQAVLCQAGAELNGGRPFPPSHIAMVYWFAEHPHQLARFDYPDSRYAEDLAFLQDLVQEIGSLSHFPLTADANQCSYCTYRSLCDRGKSAAAHEDILDVPDSTEVADDDAQ